MDHSRGMSKQKEGTMGSLEDYYPDPEYPNGQGVEVTPQELITQSMFTHV